MFSLSLNSGCVIVQGKGNKKNPAVEMWLQGFYQSAASCITSDMSKENEVSLLV